MGFLKLSLSFRVIPFFAHIFLQVVRSMFNLCICTKYKCHILGKRVDLARNVLCCLFHAFHYHSMSPPWWNGGDKLPCYVNVFPIGFYVIMIEKGIVWERKSMVGMSIVIEETPTILQPCYCFSLTIWGQVYYALGYFEHEDTKLDSFLHILKRIGREEYYEGLFSREIIILLVICGVVVESAMARMMVGIGTRVLYSE